MEDSSRIDCSKELINCSIELVKLGIRSVHANDEFLIVFDQFCKLSKDIPIAFYFVDEKGTTLLGKNTIQNHYRFPSYDIICFICFICFIICFHSYSYLLNLVTVLDLDLDLDLVTALGFLAGQTDPLFSLPSENYHPHYVAG